MSMLLRTLASFTLFLAGSGVAYAQGDEDGTLMDAMEGADGSPGAAPALQDDEEDEGDTEGDEEEEGDDEEASDDQDASAGEEGSDGEAEEREPPPPPRPASESGTWKVGKPGLSPALGAILFPGGGVAAVGASAKLPFWQETPEKLRWGGYARAQGQLLIGTTDLYSGYATRLGVFAGPRYAPLSLDVGPDFFYANYLVSGIDSAPFSGVGLPATATFAVKGLGLYAGVEPAWYVSGNWPSVDWDSEEMFGFGDEFTYLVGGSVATGGLALGLGYSYRITGYGVQRGISIGLGF